MVLEVALMGLAIHLLVWDKLPNWGSWFKSLIAGLPEPMRTLYEQWRCSYCAGFWIALALHALTGIWTLPKLAAMPEYLGLLGTPIAWFLDAIATATLIFIGAKILAAIGRSEMTVRLTGEPAARPREQDDRAPSPSTTIATPAPRIHMPSTLGQNRPT